MFLQIRAFASLGFRDPLYGFLLYAIIVLIRDFGCTLCFQQIFEKEYQATLRLEKKSSSGLGRRARRGSGFFVGGFWGVSVGSAVQMHFL